MKKVILGAAALLFSGAMFAQTVNLPNQSDLKDANGGDSMDANEVAHLGTSTQFNSGNVGEAIQNGNTNKVKVRQAGTNQSAYSVQSDGSGTGDNRARIWQTGAVFGDSGFRNVADVRQKGTENEATAQQEGDTNEAVIRQGMKDGGASTGNRAFINHGIGENGETNYAMTEQDGQTNTSKTVQVYDNNEARTVQEGDDNMGDIRQNSGPNQTDGHTALLEQYGDENASRIRQFGSNNKAQSLQVGNRNKVNQTQTSGVAGTGNYALATQGSTVSNPIGSVTGILAVESSTQSVDNVTNGSFNGPSDDAKALQIQTGDDNVAATAQFGTGSSVGNVAEQRQTGDGNTAYAIQNFFGSANGGDNYARQDQTGDDNKAGVAQNGSDHLAYQRQIGDGNEMYSTQRGSDNHLSTYQGGDNNIAETGQRGVGNTILLVQKQQNPFGGHSFKVSQNLPGGTPVGSPNGGNIADVLQLGPGGDFATDGEGCDFHAPTDLTMPDGVGTFDIDNPCDDGTGTGC